MCALCSATVPLHAPVLTLRLVLLVLLQDVRGGHDDVVQEDIARILAAEERPAHRRELHDRFHHLPGNAQRRTTSATERPQRVFKYQSTDFGLPH